MRPDSTTPTTLENVSLFISNYKCFGEQRAGFDQILPINLIIGRNNSGKSTLIDLIEYVTEPKDLTGMSHKGLSPTVSISSFLPQDAVYKVFQENSSGGGIDENHRSFGEKIVGYPITWEIGPGSNFGFITSEAQQLNNPNLGHWQKLLVNVLRNPFQNFQFKRLLADRDILPEEDHAPGPVSIMSNGIGATTAIQQFINYSNLPSELVEKTILRDLNQIFEPDGLFTDILVQQHQNGKWEVYLEELNKGRVSLSHTGSGLKTILLVLVYIHLVPAKDGNLPLSKYLYGFEELENNLHPALQRRLLLYLRDKAVKENCRFFLTTHSSVAIDLFAQDNQAQIIHVTHDGDRGCARRVTTYVENRGILDDLDVRASDLLQSNGVVWVEGPSDRLYFNRWVTLWSDGKLEEGSHYQCIFYGGRLLAHLSAADPDVDSEEVVKILRVNRNAILLIDSDRANENDLLNATKTRLIEEVEGIGGLVWVTKGAEIENYIPTEALASKYDNSEMPILPPYQEFSYYLDAIEPNEGTRFLRNKVLFAERMLPHITKTSMEKTLDLAEMVERACSTIRNWNGRSSC